ncbi:hypothetical protein Taro_053069, partial [Colocasia esculenta]|nr:hypothetical protein [Colocasia esculenta]
AYAQLKFLAEILESCRAYPPRFKSRRVTRSRSEDRPAWLGPRQESRRLRASPENFRRPFSPKTLTLLLPATLKPSARKPRHFFSPQPRNPRRAKALHCHHLAAILVPAPCITIVSDLRIDTRHRSVDDINSVHRLSPRIATPRHTSPSVPSTVGRAREPLFEPSDTTFVGRGGILIISASNLVYHVKMDANDLSYEDEMDAFIFACDYLDVNCDYFFRMESIQSQDSSSSKKGNNNFRWSISMSRSMKKCLVEQAANGMKVEKSFKRPAFVATARAVSEKFKVTCSDSNVENHLRTLKTKYATIKKLKGMSGVGWNDDAKMITMDEDTFNEYIAAHPKDEPYINKSIDMYEELVVICADDQATGSFSRTVADSVVDVDSTSMDAVNEETSETPPPPRSVEDHSTSSEQVKRGRKRRRDLDSKIDLLANKIGDLASAISRSRNRDISFELYEDVMKCTEYDKSELVKAFDFLPANEIQARSFLARDDALLMGIQKSDDLVSRNEGMHLPSSSTLL